MMLENKDGKRRADIDIYYKGDKITRKSWNTVDQLV
jgi:hypothetical protein